MGVLYAGRTAGKPLMAGRVHNAYHGGRLLWPVAPANSVVKVDVTLADGSPVPSTLDAGGSLSLAATATYGDGSESGLLTGEHVTFSTSTPDVVTVTGNVVQYKSGGVGMVTAMVGGFTSTAIRLDCEYVPEEFKVTPDPVTVRVGETVNVQVGVTPAEAPQSFDATIGDETVARLIPAIVTDPGEVTVRVGETVDVACRVVPVNADQRVTPVSGDPSIATVAGGTPQLSIAGTPDTGVAGSDVTLAVTSSDGATNLTITWESSDPATAAFEKLGAAPMHKILTLKQAGRVTVTASRDGWKPDTLEFIVTPAEETSRKENANG